ncbi:hypothetical protein D2L64_23890 [Micromonospora radicis]|uniref:Uncharacterized protein n=1 Tax=Micromonospora radicis TaxID=1894971 RepID=A0A418MP19_9ACTN|nr:hypothetical protein D2L64_23890 [Micromonospora radicis]
MEVCGEDLSESDFVLPGFVGSSLPGSDAPGASAGFFDQDGAYFSLSLSPSAPPPISTRVPETPPISTAAPTVQPSPVIRP